MFTSHFVRGSVAALALLFSCAGLHADGGPFQCSANAAATPRIRAEGFTELVGEVVITCTGGPAVNAADPIPTANITIFFGTNVTSRLLGNSDIPNASEALLLIDEPG